MMEYRAADTVASYKHCLLTTKDKLNEFLLQLQIIEIILTRSMDMNGALHVN